MDTKKPNDTFCIKNDFDANQRCKKVFTTQKKKYYTIDRDHYTFQCIQSQLFTLNYPTGHPIPAS